MSFDIHNAEIGRWASEYRGPKFDAVLCDPPYGYAFMGKAWDHGVPSAEIWRAVYDILNPGAFLLAFGGTRTHHRLMVAIEDAGFELRDCMMWLYGSGFPKSNNFGREVEGWTGYGTALKPSWEPCIVAMKPCDGTFAENAVKYGVAGINIEASRVAGEKGSGVWGSSNATVNPERTFVGSPDAANYKTSAVEVGGQVGRWPSNVILDPESAMLLDEQTGELTSGANPSRRGSPKFRNTYGEFEGQDECEVYRGVDSGGASRFFYCAKVSREERDAGLAQFNKQELYWSSGDQNPGSFQAEGTDRSARNPHPCLKPIDLCRYLARMVLPPRRTEPRKLLVPFSGSGSEMIGALMAGWDEVVGVESDTEYGYCEIAKARVNYWLTQPEIAQGSLFNTQGGSEINEIVDRD